MGTGEGELSRRERDRLRHREEVMAAAEALFAEQGFHAVTMQQIAAKAEFSVGSLYQLFDGKERLYEAVFEKKIGRFMAILDELLAAKASPLRTIEKLIDAHVAFFLEERTFFQIYISETRGFIWNIRAAMDEKLRADYRRYLALIGQVFERAIARGELRPFDAEDLTLAFFGVIHTFLSHWTAEDMKVGVEEGAERIKRIFLSPIALRPIGDA